MVRIENIAKEKITGKFDIVLKPSETHVEELELSIRIEEGDEIDLITVQRELEKDNLDMSAAKDLFNIQKKTIYNIIDRSYPEQDSTWKKSIASKFGNEILLEVYFILGLKNRRGYAAFIKEQERKIELIEQGKLDEVIKEESKNEQ